MPSSTIGVHVLVAPGARARLDSLGDTVAIHPTGHFAEPSLTWSTLTELEAWHHHLGLLINAERAHRVGRAAGRAALDEMDATLRKVRAR